MAPPRIFDAEKRALYLDALSEGANHNRAALRAGVHTNTVQRIRITEPDFEAEVARAHAWGRRRLTEDRHDRELDAWNRAREIHPGAPPSPWLLGRLQMLAASAPEIAPKQSKPKKNATASPR